MSNGNSACRTCGGTGRVRKVQGFYTVERACPLCHPEAHAQEKERASRSGYVYILLLTAGVVKIGHTHRHPEDRAGEWDLTLLAYARSEDSADAERRLHEFLAKHRKGSYELFEISFRQAVRALSTVVGEPTIVHEP
jgi:Meiotically up-regulated gene 113